MTQIDQGLAINHLRSRYQTGKTTPSQVLQAIYAHIAAYNDPAIVAKVDILTVPTTGIIYSIAEVQVSPLQLNSNLGPYTNFVNLLDLSAISIPNGFQQNGLPTGLARILIVSDRHSYGGVNKEIATPPVKEAKNCSLSALIAPCPANKRRSRKR